MYTCVAQFLQHINSNSAEHFHTLDNPVAVQSFLDSIPYRPDDIYPSALSVYRDGVGHCFDGGLFGAVAMANLGFAPMIIDLIPWNDDDHILVPFRVDGCWGAIAKSNYVGLRYREPVYRTIRELVMSYFEQFYNTNAERSLRGYTRPFYLDRVQSLDWAVNDEHAAEVMNRLSRRKKIPVLSEAQVNRLNLLDRRSYDAGMLGTNLDGVYKASPI